MYKIKKTISPVVATALLLVVAVVAVIGFQSWFGTYSSEVYIKTEKESQSSSAISIENIVGNQLYLKSEMNIYIKQILINENICSFTGNISGVQNISLNNCLDSLNTNILEVVVLTEDKIITKKMYLKNVQESLSLSGINPIYTNIFISVWNTSDNGVSTNTQIALPLLSSGIYDFYVTGTNLIDSPVHITNYTKNILNFTTSGIQEINITGTIIGFKFLDFEDMTDDDTDDGEKLYEIKAWGPLRLINDWGYFMGCYNFNYTGNDSLHLEGITSLISMFESLTNFNGNISNWDTSSITDMSAMFADAISFNQDISNWDTSSVTDMSAMFYGASTFNQDISNWDTSSVTNMYRMFYGANAFNQDLSNWNVNQVTNCMNFNETTTSWTLAQPTFSLCIP